MAGCPVMAPRSARILSTIVGSIVTGVYWIAFFYIAYALTSGDRRPGTPGGDSGGTVTAIIVYAIGFALYALVAWVWRSIDLKLLGVRDR